MNEIRLPVASYQSLGACDGPSLRTVLFLYGCPLRCDYCHNPETWTGGEYTEETLDHWVKKILRNKPYFNKGGGVTVSGGDPLIHQNKLVPFFEMLKKEEIHTCIDTSACVPVSKDLLEVTDLFLLDIKFLSGEEYLQYTGMDIFDHLIHFLEESHKQGIPLWIRHVLYPQVTDNENYVRRILAFTEKYDNIKRIDLLPFKNICTNKYENLKIPFKMQDTTLTPMDEVTKLKNIVATEMEARTGEKVIPMGDPVPKK